MTKNTCFDSRKADATVQCPIEPGEYEVVQTVALPKEIPRGIPCRYRLLFSIAHFKPSQISSFRQRIHSG